MLKEFFNAKSIAVIGASRNKEKVGHIIFKNLAENKSLRVFPVNPKAESILGHKTYRDVLEIPYNKTDLAIIAIKAEFVPEVLEQCGKKGIRSIVIVSAGFKESGNSELEEQIREIGKKHSMKILGPNVLGFILPYREINASFFEKIPEKGKIALISQSGAVADAILDISIQKKIGLSGFVGMGNMLEIDFLDALEYFSQDKNTEIILLYIESLKQETGRKFIELCRKISRNKKIIAIKAGKTQEGLKAAKTHTASVSSDSEIYSAAFKQAGVIEVESVREIILLGEIFSKYKNLGKKAGIVSNAGGAGVLASDALSGTEVELADIPEKILNEFDKSLDKGYSRRNPLDILGDATAERYESVLNILEKERLFDFFIVLLTPQAMTQGLETARVLARLKKPVFACFIGGESLEESKKFMKENKIVNFEDLSDLRILGKI